MKIPVNRPLLNGNEGKYLQECIDTGWISSEGPFVERFEMEFATKVSRKHGIAVSSGTAALDIAFELIDLQPGDEIIVPAFTIISCIHQIIRRGAIPVLVDSEADTWNMDTTMISSRITSRTRAILAVHIYGLPTNMTIIESLAAKFNLFIIEDAAEAHGLAIDGKPCGSFGDVSIFSFYPNKLITTGEGGMLVTNNDTLALRSRSLRNLCFAQPRYVHESIGWNYRMTNLQAALGVAQIERWDEFIQRKQQIGKSYTKLLADVDEIQIPITHTDFAQNVYWVFGVVLRNGQTGEQVISLLDRMGVSTRSFFCPLHLQPVLINAGLFKGESYPVAEKLWRYGLYLPSGVGTTDDEIYFSAKSLRKVIKDIVE